MTSFLIRNAAAILTGLPGDAARAAGPDLRVRDGKIAALGRLAPEPGEATVDATDCVIYPAWVNTHHHLFQSLVKGDPAGINLTLTPWLGATPYKYRGAFDAESFRLAVRIGLVELALSGCGTVADHNYLYYPGMRFDSSEIVFDEAEKLGLRMVLCRGGQTRTRQLEADLPQALRPESLDHYLSDLDRLATRFHDPAPDAMRRVVAAPTTPPYSMSPSELREVAQFARSRGLRLHSHLSETVGYQDSVHSMHQRTPVHFCAEHDWTGPDVWFAHLVHLDADEIALLGQTRTGIAHCPQSNGRLGSGIAPVRALEDAGSPVSIAVDGAASNEAADMISEVHAAWLMARAKAGDASRARCHGGRGEAGADAATVEDVVRWGTAGGARVLGLEAVGTLAPGRAADIALYSLAEDPRYFGMLDAGVAPVACGGAARLAGLWVAGRQVVRDGRVAGGDLRALGRAAREAVAALERRAALA